MQDGKLNAADIDTLKGATDSPGTATAAVGHPVKDTTAPIPGL
ncbi:hypothetical protein BOO71_0014332 [Deinococcus marmoris]|uniref:Uncharacterized protein n=1 Tax=Deinococcus marmoris TaxID=249408 RepID=A0A1U7NRX3_9DEIO|nr:hypothetical protein BOO71_0014332 [Deinococcus marmoris]